MAAPASDEHTPGDLAATGNSTISEFALIAAIRAAAEGGAAASGATAAAREGVRCGIGDDTAVLVPPPGELLVTTDTMVEGVHFRWDFTTPDAVGSKAAATNLSDIAAMGGAPLHATLALSLPAPLDARVALGIVSGCVATLAQFGAVLVGGDITGSPGPVVVTITLLGVAPHGGSVRRRGAASGDDVWVAGVLGDAAWALRTLTEGGCPPPDLARALHTPRPRLGLARALAAAGLMRAACDVSDGFVQDLGHICRASGVAAFIDGAALPLSPVLRTSAAERAVDPLPFAATGGEDYALVFTARPADRAAVHAAAAAFPDDGPLARVGTLQAGAPVVTVLRDGAPVTLSAGGFDHFRRYVGRGAG